MEDRKIHIDKLTTQLVPLDCLIRAAETADEFHNAPRYRTHDIFYGDRT